MSKTLFSGIRQEKLIAKIPPHLEPFEKNGYVRFNCPVCGPKGRGKAWISGRNWSCNRTGTCGAGGLADDITGKSTKANHYKYKPGRDKQPAKTLTPNQTRPALRKLTEQAKDWLRSRLGYNNLYDAALKLAKAGYLGDTSQVGDAWAAKKADEGYQLFTPLFLLGAACVVSGQVRWTGKGPPNEDWKGQSLKAMSLAGYSTLEGATFGRSDLALERAVKNKEPIYLGEGAPDWLVLSTLGKNALAVAGVSIAARVAKWIGEQGEDVDLVLCLDPDDAGQKAVKAVKKALADFPNVKLFNAELPRDEDINDLLVNRGPGAVFDCLDNAKHIQGGVANRKNQEIIKEHSEHRSKLRALGMWAEPRYYTSKHKGKLRSAAQFLRDVGDVRWKTINKLATSGETSEYKVSEYSDGSRESGGAQKKYSDATLYQAAQVRIWNGAVCDWFRAKLAEMGESVYVGTVPFESREDAEAKRRGLAQFADSRHAPDMMVLTDPARGRLVVLLTGQAADKAISRVGASAPDIELWENEKAIVERIMPCWFGGADYIFDQLDEPQSSIAHDPWLLKRFNRFNGRGLFATPPAKAFRDKSREEMKLLKEAREAISLANDPDRRIPIRELFVSANNHSGQVAAITFEPCSFDNISRINLGMSPNFNPDSAGNLLCQADYRNTCIDLIEWLNKEEGLSLDISEFPGSRRYMKAAQEAAEPTREYSPPIDYGGEYDLLIE
jgi:hypothetical protein